MTIEDFKNMLNPFFEQGEETLFVSSCCGRLYVGTAPAISCRTCPNKPEVHEIKDIEKAGFVFGCLKL